MKAGAPSAVPSQKKTENSVKTQKQVIAKVDDRSYINIVSTDDYVEIIKAQLKPVVYDKWELGQVFYTIVCGLQNMSHVRFYGVTMFAEILHGSDSKSKRILDNGLDKIPEFGALKDMPREMIQSIIEWMITEHYILKTKGSYPVLHSTYEGLHYSENLTEGKLKKLKKYLEDEAILRL